MLTSILRTVVPALWGGFIGWALTLVPALEPLREQLLAYGDLAAPIIGAVIIGAWYALWRKLEPRLPDWLTRILLGSAQAPVYAKHAIIGEQVLDGEITGWHDAGKPKHSADDDDLDAAKMTDGWTE